MNSAQWADPGQARQPMITDEVDHDAVANPIWAAMECAVGVARTDNYAEVNIPHLLRSMRETHGSMRAIYTAAKKIETEAGKPTGRWADMLVLARAQFDSVFIGLLLAHNPTEWGPRFYKAGWATDAQYHFYASRRFASVESAKCIHNYNVFCLKARARLCQVTTKEWVATLAAVRGRPLRFGATESDRLKPFPTPGRIVDLVKAGPYETLASLLWQEWKFLCDPAHSGFATVALRHGLRDQQFGGLGTLPRNQRIHRNVVAPSAHVSLVAIITLITVLATMHRDKPEVLAAVTKAWEIFEKGTREGGIVWDNWVSKALGVLSP